MTEEETTAAQPWADGGGHVPPDAQMMSLLMQAWVVQAISVVTRLGVPAALAGGPRPVADVAVEVGAVAPALKRVLRALAEIGIVAELPGPAPDTYALTPLGRTLVPGEPGSVANLAVMTGSEWQRDVWTGMYDVVRTGRPATYTVWGSGLFSFLAEHPQDAAVFNAAMVEAAAGSTAAVAASYDFGRFGTIVDVGGGHGYLLGAVLAAHPGVSGVLFDRPEVVDGAEANLKRLGVADRVELVGGSFFDAVPAGGDGYLLSNVIHDWDDEHVLVILRNVRAAAGEDATLLLSEWVLPDGPEPYPAGKIMDLQMLVSTDDGRERTRGEFAALLGAAGFRLTGEVVGGPGLPTILEARPA
jgi:hypothetical protein